MSNNLYLQDFLATLLFIYVPGSTPQSDLPTNDIRELAINDKIIIPKQLKKNAVGGFCLVEQHTFLAR